MNRKPAVVTGNCIRRHRSQRPVIFDQNGFCPEIDRLALLKDQLAAIDDVYVVEDKQQAGPGIVDGAVDVTSALHDQVSVLVADLGGSFRAPSAAGFDW